MGTTSSAEKRACVRFVPKGVVSLSIHQGEFVPSGYGVVRDISERGVRVVTDRVLWQGQRLRLRLRFEDERDLVDAKGRVCWHRPGSPQAGEEMPSTTGIELSLTSEAGAERVRALLGSERFAAVESTVDADANRVFTPLTPYLEQLADLFSELGPGPYKR